MTLASRPLLETLAGEPLAEWDRFAPEVRTCRAAAGSTIFHADQSWPWMAVIGTGIVKLVYLRADGGERIKSFIAEGGFFASLAALVPNGHTSFAAVAMTDVQLEQIPYAALRDFGDRHIAWQRAMRAALQHYGARKEKRERELLVLTPEERYRSFLAEEPALAARVPQKDLALYLGITPVALSRIRGRLRHDGADALAKA